MVGLLDRNGPTLRATGCGPVADRACNRLATASADGPPMTEPRIPQPARNGGTSLPRVEPAASTVSTWTVLFTDITASTELRSGLGEDAFDAVRREHDRLSTEAVHAHGGTVVKHTGDGVMAVFAGASDALAGAARLQQSFARRNGTAKVPLA